jgi:hypothetical protein
MQTMRHGRKPKAALSVVPKVPGHIRPAPPDDLTKPEQEVWTSVVGAMPPHWFGPETWPVLRELCFQVVTAKTLKQRLRALDKDDFRSFRTLMLLCRHESKVITELSQRLRITPSSRVNSRKAEREYRNGATKRPWEVISNEEEDDDRGDSL